MIYNVDNSMFIIFKKDDNVKFSKFTKFDMDYFFYFLNKHILNYRKKLNFSSDITFGLSIGYERFNPRYNDIDEFRKVIGCDNWELNYSKYSSNENFLRSQMYTDTEQTWTDLEKVCRFSNVRLNVMDNAITSVNIGSQIFGNNSLYWYRLLKLWSIYENIIYRFSYGEYLSLPYAKERVKPVGDIILNRLEYYKKYMDMETFNFICNIFSIKYKHDDLNKNGISFYNMFDYFDYSENKDDLYVSFRTPVSTFDSVILQNYINFFIHLMLYCKSNKYNDDILDKRRMMVSDIIGNIDNYDNIYLEQAVELGDLIFNKTEDKVYFLKQYLKDMELSSKNNIVTNRLTRRMY